MISFEMPYSDDTSRVTHWNYRLFHRRYQTTLSRSTWSDEYSIREAYYENNQIVSWAAEPTSLYGECKDDVLTDIPQILKAMTLPVVELTADGERLADAS